MTKCYFENFVFQNITQSFIGKLDLTVGDYFFPKSIRRVITLSQQTY